MMNQDTVRTWRPDVDIVESADAFWLWADLPGVAETAVDVKLEDETLTIEGRVEQPAGRLAHRFIVSSEIDAEQIEAKMKHGVLELRLPKAARILPRRIAIQTG